MTKDSPRFSTKAQDIQRWVNAGYYDMANKAIERALGMPKYCSDMAKWLYEQKNGKAAQGVELNGSVAFSLTDLAKEALSGYNPDSSSFS